MASLASLMLAIVGVALASLAVSDALATSPEMGVIGENPGGQVIRVEPGSYAWSEGIRAGQRVVALTSSDSPGGWSFTTSDGAAERSTSTASAVIALGTSLPAAVGALTLAVLGLLLLPRRRDWGVSLAALACILASVPFSISAPAPLAVVGRLAALGMPAAVVLVRLRWRPAVGVLALSTVALGVAWLATWTSAAPAYDTIDSARSAGAWGFGVALVAVQIDRRRAAELVREFGGMRVLDAVALAACIIAVVALLVVGVPVVAVVLGAAIAVGLYPRWRGTAGTSLDRWLFRDVRERAAVSAVESERGKLARDLHDVPLQELTGVIRTLERVDGAAEANASLREVADHLRAIATELRPPVLEDLGLAAALEFLAAQAQRYAAEVVIEATLEQDGVPGDPARLPRDVELALYRIVQEAVSNAVRHAGAHSVVIDGQISAEAVVLSVADDGGGLPAGAVERALREGRMGLESMRQRAAAIGARLQLDGSAGHGVVVRVEWRA